MEASGDVVVVATGLNQRTGFVILCFICTWIIIILIASTENTGRCVTVNTTAHVSSLHSRQSSASCLDPNKNSSTKNIYRSTTLGGDAHYIDILFQGRLGNLMFQYAAIYCMARANGLVPIVRNGERLMKVFHQLDSVVSDEEGAGEDFVGFSETRSMTFDARTLQLHLLNASVHLHGYYQSWRYCHRYKQELRRQFSFSQDTQHKASAFLDSINKMFSNISTLEPTFVGIHLRRGDFTAGRKKSLGYIAVEDTYIAQAVEHFSNQFPHVVFVVCSDDTSWAKANVDTRNKPVVFSPFREPELDLCLMSKCNHTIISAGTFGWWAAWLGGGQAVYAKSFPSPGSWLAEQCTLEDYYMPHWIAL